MGMVLIPCNKKSRFLIKANVVYLFYALVVIYIWRCLSYLRCR